MDFVAEKSEIWENILIRIEKELNRYVIDSWFKPIKFGGYDSESKVIHLRASKVIRDWISLNYTPLLERILVELELSGHTFEWLVDNDDSREKAFPFEESSIEKFVTIDRTETSASSLPRKAISNYPDIFESSLNPKYTFDKFIVGSSNDFAHAAALGVADIPGKTYNPLFLYGGVGLGKTHLMHAIGHAIVSRNPHMRVAYVTSERFMNELINAIRYDKTQLFRDKYRSIDVLLMDDVQFLAGKDRTQEEFFHTFNSLYLDQKQIVISADSQPREIPTLQERLHSRFEWGLIADIKPPDLETKVAILKRKADQDGIDLPDDIAMLIAGKIRSNVRELEGSLVKLVAVASLRDLPITKMLAQDLMKNYADDDQIQGLTMERISRAVAAHYKLTVDELKSKNNSRSVSFPRQIAMYLCKRLTKHSYPEIGREFSGKHHTTVMHSYEKIETLAAKDPDFHKELNGLIDSLGN